MTAIGAVMFVVANTAARRARRPGAASGPGAGRPQGRTVALIAGAGFGLSLIMIGGLAWTTPTSVEVTHPLPVRQQVALSYDAQAPRGAAYPAGRLRTGDPVFLRLVPTMDVLIDYRAELGGAPRTDGANPDTDTSLLRGTRRVTAELRSTNGWHRGLELLPRTTFTGGGFDAIASLDLTRVKALISGFTTATGITDGTYTLSIRSEIALTGPIPGSPEIAPLRDSFFPELTFAYDGKQLQLVDPTTATAVVRTRSSSVQVPGIEPQHLTVLGLELPVGPARLIGPLLGLALLVAAGLAERARRAARYRPAERIIRRIVLDDVDSSDPDRPPTRTRVPGPRAAALAARQSTRTHPASRYRD